MLKISKQFCLKKPLNLIKNQFQSVLLQNGTLVKQHKYQFSTLLIKNGLIVNADIKFKGDILIKDNKIQQILKPGQEINANNVIDAKGKYIIPGGIDPHVHMELEFMGTVTVDDFNHGSRASIAGGTTTFIDFIIPNEKGLVTGYDNWRARADPKVNANYALHCCITHWNEQVSKEMGEMVKRGVSSFKLFMAYKGTSLYHPDSELIEILQRCKELGAITLVHAENVDLINYNCERLNKKGIYGPEGHLWSRGEEIEAEAVHRIITMAKEINTPLYVVHIMKPSAAEVVRDAKKKGYVVFAEALASGLGVDGRHCYHHDFNHASGYIMSPALDDKPMTKELLFKLLATHDLDTTATDNCVFTKQQKKMGVENFRKIPNGINGIEDRMSVVWSQGVNTGVLSPSDFVRVTSTNTAKIFNMYPQKGVIQAGSDADVVIWDPEASKVISAKTHHHAGDFNIFEGIKVKGLTDTTIVNGKIVYQDGKILSHQGSGKYIGRENYGFAYERIPLLEKVRDIIETPVDRSKKAELSLQQKYENLKNENEVSQSKLQQQALKIEELLALLPKNTNLNVWDSKFKNEITSVENVLQKFLPDKEFEAVRQILFGSRVQELKIPQKAIDISNQFNFDIYGYTIPSHKEELRQPRIVRIGAVQNSIKAPTSAPIKQQQNALLDWMKHVVEAAHHAGVNVLGVQECWNMPFFMCTREKYPWIEFAEDYQNGPSALLFKELAQKYNMIIVNHILERDSVKGTVHNTSVLINNHGKVLGKFHKNHIPRVGDFNESTYYMEGELGHPVFETDFGNIAINICYGRHHPLHWLMLGLNGAEIVFNPSATVGNLSEPMWAIEARCAAIANHYFSVSINRVGTEYYKNSFTSGDGKPPHHEFGMFYGSSYVSAPDASRTPGLSRTRDGLLVTEVDLNLCRQISDKWGFNMTRRLEMYGKQISQAAQENYKQQLIK